MPPAKRKPSHISAYCFKRASSVMTGISTGRPPAFATEFMYPVFTHERSALPLKPMTEKIPIIGFMTASVFRYFTVKILILFDGQVKKKRAQAAAK